MSETTYSVGLARNANSFYDPQSGCNLFKNTPRYDFNHPPTADIKTAVAGGRLIDIQGNIFDEALEKEKLQEALDKREAKSKAVEQTDADLAAKEEEAINKAKGSAKEEVADSVKEEEPADKAKSKAKK